MDFKVFLLIPQVIYKQIKVCSNSRGNLHPQNEISLDREHPVHQRRWHKEQNSWPSGTPASQPSHSHQHTENNMYGCLLTIILLKSTWENTLIDTAKSLAKKLKNLMFLTKKRQPIPLKTDFGYHFAVDETL